MRVPPPHTHAEKGETKQAKNSEWMPLTLLPRPLWDGIAEKELEG